MEPGAGRPSPSGGTVLRRNRHSAMKTRLPDESSFGADCCPSIGIPPPPPLSPLVSSSFSHRHEIVN